MSNQKKKRYMNPIDSENMKALQKVKHIKSTSLIETSKILALREPHRKVPKIPTKLPALSKSTQKINYSSSISPMPTPSFFANLPKSKPILSHSFFSHAKFLRTQAISPESSPEPMTFKLEIPYKSFCETVFEKIIEEYFLTSLDLIVIESAHDMISACLILFSSSILDNLVQNVLNEMVPVAASQAYAEILDNNFILYEEEFVDSLILVDLIQIAKETCCNLFCEDIFSGIFEGLKIKNIVKSAVAEEKKANKRILNSIFDSLVDNLLQEEWIEYFAEDEICAAKISSNFKILPQNLQTQIIKKNDKELISQAIEEIYFELINEFVATRWLENLVNFVAKGIGTYDDLFIMCVSEVNLMSRKRFSLFIPPNIKFF